MTNILDGIVLGLSLAILLGPIFVVLIDTSMRIGARAGLMVGMGIWFSDVLFILAMYGFINQLHHLSHDATFFNWVGKLGAFILIMVGSIKMFNKNTVSTKVIENRFLRNLGFFGKGFVVNTFNPFTFVFWFGVMGSRLLQDPYNSPGVLITCVTILSVIIASDSTKILAAKWLSRKIQPSVVPKINFAAGVLLIIAGLILLGKTGF